MFKQGVANAQFLALLALAFLMGVYGTLASAHILGR